MGKKGNKNARNSHKDKRTPTFSPKTISQDNILSNTTIINGVSLIKETKTCPHLQKGINFENFSLKLASLESHKCDDCRDGITDRRTKKGKKNKANSSNSNSKSESSSIWVCLECGHFSCGGIGFPTTPQTHAARHSKQNRHPLVIQFANPNLRWCFYCNTLIPAQSDEQKDDLSEFVKALKTQSLARKSLDDTTEVNSENTLEVLSGGYVVRGLVNLGNTCFFNSVMQNLLAMDKLRDYFLRLEGTIGPLMVSLKKLFIESCQSTGGKNVINPRSFFGCVCVKAPQFRGFQQHDSHELLRCLLDGLCSEESRVQNRAQNCNGDCSFVDTIFGGKISSTVSCLECGYNSVVYEPCLDLSLPLPTKKSVSRKVQPVSRFKKPKVAPKKPGKFRSKSKKGSDSKVDRSGVKFLVNGECVGPTKSIIELCGNEEVDSIGLEETTSWLDYLEPTSESCNEDSSGIQDSGAGNGVSWKDESEVKVQEFEVMSTTESHNEDLSGIQDSGNIKKVSRKDVQESEVTSSTESRNPELPGIEDSGIRNGVSCKDGPGVKVQESEVTSTTGLKIPDLSGIGDSGNSNGVSCEDEPRVKVQESEVTSTTESQILDLSGIGDSGNSNTLSCKDEQRVKVQESEVTSTMESQIPDLSGIGDSGNSNAVSCKDEQRVKVQESKVTTTMESQILDLSGIENLKNSNGVSCKDEPRVKVQESEVTSTTESQNPDLSGIEDSGNSKGVSCKDEQLVKVQESEVTSTTESQNPDLSGIEDSGNSKGVSCKDEQLVKVQESEVTSITESLIPDLSGIEDSGNSNGVSCKDEKWEKVQESEVTSITESKIPDLSGIEDSGNSNEVLTTGNNEITQEPLEFDGFGGLFDEPELDVIPLSNGDEKRGLMATSNSQSDSDEVDDANSPLSVEKCLAYFTTPELLSKTEHAWQCDQCSKQQMLLTNKYGGKNGISNGTSDSGIECRNESDDDVDSKVARDASKRILISRAPPVLTIHLKRFCQDGRGRLSKLNGHVSFRDTLDLKPYMDPSCCKDRETYKYKLVGVVEHLGSMRGGHYVAYVKGGCIWYHASDAYVRVASLEEVLRCEAYILFYEAM